MCRVSADRWHGGCLLENDPHSAPQQVTTSRRGYVQRIACFETVAGNTISTIYRSRTGTSCTASLTAVVGTTCMIATRQHAQHS